MSEQDTREKLEADVLSIVRNAAIWARQKIEHGEGNLFMLDEYDPMIRELLDRQAVITEREASERHKKYCAWCEQVTDRRIAELTAEVEKQRQRANDAERGALSDEWYVARDRYEDDVAALTAERDQLQAAIYVMENGQFYAMYKAKCEECEQLKKVVRTQADSFKKLEIELGKQ